MPFNPAIPQANQRIRDSQPPILENFTVIDRAWNINHVTFDAANEGKHKWVTCPDQAGDPAILGTEVAIFSKNSGYTGVSELFFRKPVLVPPGTDITYEWTSSEHGVNAWTFLPSGILVKWGLVAPGGMAANAAHITPYPVALTIPVFTAAYMVSVSPYHAGTDAATVRLMDWNLIQHRVYVTVPVGGTNPGYTYIAIGT